MATHGKHPNPGRRLRLAFLLSYLAGAAVIGTSVVVPLELHVLIGLPNAVMLIYILGFIVRRRPAYLVEPFADSLYYLGFLFTVTSLLASLLPYGLEASALSVEAILSQFGVALTTTLFGLIGRVFFRQFAIPVDQAATEAQESISDRTDEFSQQVEMLIERFRGTVDRLNSELEQTVITSVDGIQAAGATGIAELGDTAAAAREMIGQSTASIVDQLENRMDQAFHRGNTSIDEFGQTMEALRDKTAMALEPFSTEMKDLVTELRNVREASVRNEERISRIFESYEMMIAKLREAQESGDRFQEQLGTRLSALVTALEGASRTIETLSGDSKAAIGGLGHEIDGVRDARTALADDAAAFAEIRARLTKDLHAALDISAMNRSVAGRDDPIAENLTIDDDAFGEPDRGAGRDEAYIPPLLGRQRRPRGPA